MIAIKTMSKNSFDSASAVLNPEHAVENILAKRKVDVVNRRTTVRNGVAFIFELRASGTTYVHATRRSAPHRTAMFQVADREAALAWLNDGVLPPGEISVLLPQLEAGTWPAPASPDPKIRYPN